jgi:hypothetical protein
LFQHLSPRAQVATLLLQALPQHGAAAAGQVERQMPVQSGALECSNGERIMQMPTKIKIGYRDFDIEVAEYIPHHSLGLSNWLGGVITLLRNQKKPELANTFIHEIMHMVRVFARIDDVKPSERSDEFIVAALSNGWCMVLHDNPEFARWLIGALR